MFKKSLFLFSGLFFWALPQIADATPIRPASAINHDDCAEHLIYLVQGVRDSGLRARETNKLIREAKKFNPEVNGYTVNERTAAWSNFYNPMTDGGADANWIDGLHGPSHPLNDVFFRNGEYNTRRFKSAADIKRGIEALSQEELNSLPSIRKYDIAMGDFSMSATKEQIKYFGTERRPSPERWEGFCYPMRLIGATCPVPSQSVSREIPGTNKTVDFSPYDVATIAAAHWNGTSLYARMGSVNRATRDREPPNAGAYHIMLQAYKAMKEKYAEKPFAAVFDVEPNAEIWNEALQNWSSEYGEVLELTAAQIRTWRAPTGAQKYVDVRTNAQLTHETTATDNLTRSTVANGRGMNSVDYEYRLYLDNNDQIVGGAWLHDSGRSYPDLVGFANGYGTGTDNLDHDTVVQLLRDSTEETDHIIPGT